MSIQKDKIAIVVIFALQLALLSLDMKNFLCVCVACGGVCVLTTRSAWLPFPNTYMFWHKSSVQSPGSHSTVTAFHGREKERETFTR